MIKRKIDHFLDTFFRNTKKALLVTGARQIGKTFSIREAAKRNFEHFVEINFITSHNGNIETKNKVVYMPIYMLMFLEFPYNRFARSIHLGSTSVPITRKG